MDKNEKKLINILKPDFIYNDDRGFLVQLIHQGYRQVNVIQSNTGAIRGGHYHKKNKEAFYVIKGELKLEVWDCESSSFNGALENLLNRSDQTIKEFSKGIESYTFKAGDMFEILPLVVHSFTFIRDTILVSMYSSGIELSDGTKDIFKCQTI